MLAELMRLKQCVAIAGTHGKTTTTSLVATLLDAAWAAVASRPRPGGGGGGAAGGAGARAVGVLAAAVALGAVAGFLYWGVPYVYGVKLSPEAALARRWRSAWVT